MTPWRTVILVARRDFWERVKSRAFQIATAATLLLVLAGILVPRLLIDSDQTWRVGVVGYDSAEIVQVIDALGGQSEAIVTGVRFATEDEAADALDKRIIDVAVVADTGVQVGRDTPSVLGTLAVTALNVVRLTDLATEMGASPGEIATVFDPVGLAAASVDQSELPNDDASLGLAFFATVLLFISIVTYGQWILVGVIEEKSNRVVEVVVAAVRPRLLLAGKVLGIGLLGVGHMILLSLVGLIALTISGEVTLPSSTAAVILSTMFWFVAGFAFYGTVYAAAGALVSRQEEAQNAAFPLNVVLMSTYLLATYSLRGDNAIIRIASLLPPFAPMTMPSRIALGAATPLEILTSMFLMIVSVFGLLHLAGRVYEGGLLRAGAKVKLRDAWRSVTTRS